MTTITQNQRPIGRNSNYTCFYTEDVVSETEKALLVSLYFDSIGEKANRWLPKSKILAYEHIDNRELVDNGVDYLRNFNYGKPRIQYFIPSFFTKDNGSMPTCAELSLGYKDGTNRVSENDIMGVNGIDY